MTFEEYQNTVTVMITPTVPEWHHPKGGLMPEQLFWLHTSGMAKFDRPEIEMRGVPGFYVGAAGRFINTWAYHSIEKAEIKAGENLQDDSGPFPVIFTAEVAEHPWYEERGIECLRLVPAAVFFECQGNHHDDTIH
jgi:hypothetical protein